MNPPAGERDDAALVAAVFAGEAEAFTVLINRHKHTLYGLIRRYAGDAAEAHDLLQETFLAVWLALDSFDQSKSFPGWARRIALNKCRDWSRRRAVRRFFFGAVSLDSARASDISAPAEEASAEVESHLSRLDIAISNLPSPLKEALLLTAFDDLSHAAAGRLLGVSAKAIETRVYRAKARLRAQLVADNRRDGPH